MTTLSPPLLAIYKCIPQPSLRNLSEPNVSWMEPSLQNLSEPNVSWMEPWLRNLSEPNVSWMEPSLRNRFHSFGTSRNLVQGFGRLPQTTPKLYWKNPKPFRLLGEQIPIKIRLHSWHLHLWHAGTSKRRQLVLERYRRQGNLLHRDSHHCGSQTHLSLIQLGGMAET